MITAAVTAVGVFAALVTVLAGVLIVWTYAVYPLGIALYALVRPRPWSCAPFTGSVSLIVPAHNEEKVIGRKIRNSLSLDFGTARAAEIIIVSDGSLDGTAGVLDAFRDHPAVRAGRLKLISYAPRRGKPHALHTGVLAASGDVLVLSDANVFLERGALRELLAPLADPTVGAVCGNVGIRASGGDEPAGEGLYMRFESLAQRAEARVFSTIGVDGALYALRREHYRELPPDMVLDDFTLAMEVVREGKRVAYAPGARAVEETVASSSGEFSRKKRIVGGGWQFLSRFVESGGALPRAAWFMLVSHKVLRWLSPVLLLVALLANAVAALGSTLFGALLWAQALFYVLALAAAAAPWLRRHHLFFVPYYFCVINVAALAGLVEFLGRRQTTLWHKIER